ncbi:MAG: glutaredoxin 3 [Gammaproteobacteria bacterium]
MARIVMYATGWCGYCARARRLLESRKVEFEEIDVDARPEARAEMFARSGRRTVPQIFIGETHVGGCDDLMELEAAGRLDPLLKAQGT